MPFCRMYAPRLRDFVLAWDLVFGVDEDNFWWSGFMIRPGGGIDVPNGFQGESLRVWHGQQGACVSDATVGLWVDSVGFGADYSLQLRNSVITNSESIGLLSQGGYILGYNNLISNCGQACGYFALGGNIQMHLRTFANYSTAGGGLRQFPTLYVNDWYEASDGSVQWRPFTQTTESRNCIAYGNNATLNAFSEVIVDL